MVGLGFVHFAFPTGKAGVLSYVHTPDGKLRQGQARLSGSGGLYALMCEISRGIPTAPSISGGQAGRIPPVRSFAFHRELTELASRSQGEKALTDKILLIRSSRDDRAVIPPGSASTHAGRGANRLHQALTTGAIWADFPQGRLWYYAFYHNDAIFSRRLQKRLM